ncbi:spermidine acetyltransferase [Roseateles aquatilis]|uniref:Spermidine acetyltransferase n=2 Tax=Roseateles aquatilis TaxID=431061 RepID=A0A246JK42_9BURK|nr:spermidine acetyltransferase [Roseateles aquatilis]
MMTAHRVTLRPTMLSDLDFVVGVEQDAGNRPFITPWERTQHEGAIRFPDARHFIVELDAQRTGFVILQGCRNPNHSVELKRIVLGPKGQGIGRRCVRLLQKMAFEQLGAHRFWLDVKGRNTRAQALYRSEGYVEEGRLRECVRVEPAEGDIGDGAGYDDLIVMSLLRREYEARLAQGLGQA